jgi:RNA polymerase sigma-70 factor, ECF subfamily
VEGALEVGTGSSDGTLADAFIGTAEPALPGAYRLAGFLLGDEWEAQDAIQEALLKAWLAWPTLRRTESFGAWFDRIVANICKNRLRGRKGVRPVTLDEQSGGGLKTADPFRAALEQDELGRLVARLGPDLQVVVALRFWRDLSLEAIAERLDVPIGTVKSRLHYALRGLRSEIDRQGREAAR